MSNIPGFDFDAYDRAEHTARARRLEVLTAVLDVGVFAVEASIQSAAIKVEDLLEDIQRTLRETNKVNLGIMKGKHGNY